MRSSTFSTTPKAFRNPFVDSSRSKGALSTQRLIWGGLAVLVLCYIVFFQIAAAPALSPQADGVPDIVAKAQQQHLQNLKKAAANMAEEPPLRRRIAPPPMDHSQHQQVDVPHRNKVYPTGITIGYAVTVTGCGSDPITEGAAVLKHAIHLTSMHGNLGGRYNYKMYALYHPDGAECAAPLADLGYELLERETPVLVEDIKGDFLRSRIEKNGCCGEKELVKLEAYTLVQHPIVVHLDLDTLVLKPLDSLFDWMLLEDADHDTEDIPIMWPEVPHPRKVNAYFTRDYNMVGPKTKHKPVQGGFLVLRPSMSVYNEFVNIIKEGDFRENGGWGGKVGPFYGSMTFQGLIPYYYDILHPNEGVELNRCVFNQMADNPRDQPTVKDVVHGRCRTNEEDCEDCRSRPIEDVLTCHFTLCQKPWLCLPQDSDMIQQRLCRKLHHEWHRIRADLEHRWGRGDMGSGSYQADHFYGHCSKHGKNGYLPIERPYGQAVGTH